MIVVPDSARKELTPFGFVLRFLLRLECSDAAVVPNQWVPAAVRGASPDAELRVWAPASNRVLQFWSFGQNSLQLPQSPWVETASRMVDLENTGRCR